MVPLPLLKALSCYLYLCFGAHQTGQAWSTQLALQIFLGKTLLMCLPEVISTQIFHNLSKPALSDSSHSPSDHTSINCKLLPCDLHKTKSEFLIGLTCPVVYLHTLGYINTTPRFPLHISYQYNHVYKSIWFKQETPCGCHYNSA